MLLSGLIVNAMVAEEPALLYTGTAIFGCFGVLCAYLWWSLQGTVELRSDQLVRRRLGRARTIELSEILGLEFRITSQALIVRGRDQTIRIEQQLEDFETLYRALEQHASPAQQNLERRWPGQVPARRAPVVVFAGLLLLGLAVMLVPRGQNNQVPKAGGVLLVALSGLGLAMMPLSYRFSAEEISCRCLVRTRRFDTRDLRTFSLRTDASNIPTTGLPIRTLELEFTSGKLLIPESAIAFPLERLCMALEHNRPTPKARGG